MLTLPSSHSREKDPSWKHPHTLFCVVRVVHRIVLTLPSSHSREKEPKWKHPHTLFCVVRVPPWFTWIVFFVNSSISTKSTISTEDSSCSEVSKMLAPAPYASPSHFPFSDSSHIWTTSPGSPGSISASSSVSVTSRSSKEGSSSLDQSKIVVPAPYASSNFCLFSRSSCPRPPSCETKYTVIGGPREEKVDVVLLSSMNQDSRLRK